MQSVAHQRRSLADSRRVPIWEPRIARRLVFNGYHMGTKVPIQLPFWGGVSPLQPARSAVFPPRLRYRPVTDRFHPTTATPERPAAAAPPLREPAARNAARGPTLRCLRLRPVRHWVSSCASPNHRVTAGGSPKSWARSCLGFLSCGDMPLYSVNGVTGLLRNAAAVGHDCRILQQLLEFRNRQFDALLVGQTGNRKNRPKANARRGVIESRS